MTMSANRKDPERRPDFITVRTIYGPIMNEVEENFTHLRSFWHQLGAELDVAEQEFAAREADARAHRTGE